MNYARQMAVKIMVFKGATRHQPMISKQGVEEGRPLSQERAVTLKNLAESQKERIFEVEEGRPPLAP